MDKNDMRKTIIEQYGQGEYTCYRIPGIVVTAKNSILIYYELRESSSDWSVVNIGMRRSVDGGDTWSDLALLVEKPDGKATNNPVCIASQSGRVHFFYQFDYRRAFYRFSDDDGLTFSQPEDITYVFDAYREEYDWSLFAMGPGHGIEHSCGRLIIPVWLCKGEGNAHTPTVVSTIASDDGGRCFRRGEIVYAQESIGLISPNETTIAELSDGSVALNIRNGGNVLYRATCVSKDGLSGFSTPRFDLSLRDPKCFASILRTKKGLLFSNCNVIINEQMDTDQGERTKAGEWEQADVNTSISHIPEVTDPFNSFGSRTHLTVRLSLDDAKTWAFSREIALMSGYSDLATDHACDYIYCFYECNWVEGTWGIPKSLVFAKMPLPDFRS